MRQCINLLQTTFRFAAPLEKEQSLKPVPITREDLDHVATRVPTNFEDALISAVLKKDFDTVQATLIASRCSFRLIPIYGHKRMFDFIVGIHSRGLSG